MHDKMNVRIESYSITRFNKPQRLIHSQVVPFQRQKQLMKYRVFAVLAAILAVAGSAHAAGAGGGGLPWEQPINTLSNSVTGPVAYGLSLIGLVASGSVLIFAGGHVNDFFRVVLYCVLVISLIIAGKNTLTSFGFAAGAEITETQQSTTSNGYTYEIPSNKLWHYAQ
jgi:type IV secretion system protein TrbC